MRKRSCCRPFPSPHKNWSSCAQSRFFSSILWLIDRTWIDPRSEVMPFSFQFPFLLWWSDLIWSLLWCLFFKKKKKFVPDLKISFFLCVRIVWNPRIPLQIGGFYDKLKNSTAWQLRVIFCCIHLTVGFIIFLRFECAG